MDSTIGNSKSHYLGARAPLKVPCSYSVSVIRKFALLLYICEFCFYVLTAIISDSPTIYPCNWKHIEASDSGYNPNPTSASRRSRSRRRFYSNDVFRRSVSIYLYLYLYIITCKRDGHLVEHLLLLGVLSLSLSIYIYLYSCIWKSVYIYT